MGQARRLHDLNTSWWSCVLTIKTSAIARLQFYIMCMRRKSNPWIAPNYTSAIYILAQFCYALQYASHAFSKRNFWKMSRPRNAGKSSFFSGCIIGALRFVLLTGKNCTASTFFLHSIMIVVFVAVGEKIGMLGLCVANHTHWNVDCISSHFGAMRMRETKIASVQPWTWKSVVEDISINQDTGLSTWHVIFVSQGDATSLKPFIWIVHL